MNRPRQDAWTKEEDELLADIVLGHIRSGKTQLEAFRQAGEALSRTPAACGQLSGLLYVKDYSIK